MAVNHITEECKQQAAISDIKAAVMYFQRAEEQRAAREERMTTALEDIARQGARIEVLEKNNTEIFRRVNGLETHSGKEADKVKIGFWNALLAAAIALVITLATKK